MLYPFVSICTPTFNRRPFFPTLIQMFKDQTYPKNRIEWIIVDDGTDKIEDLINDCGIKQIKYVSIENKLTLGQKRNLMHNYCIGSIIIYVDDDDYFPPERISHSVDALMNAKNGELIAGSSEIYLYFKDNGLYQFGPYGPNHSTAGTFAFKRELLDLTKYNNNSCLAEEKEFLKNYTFPIIQLDPRKTILVFPHEHNSFDKHTLLKEDSNSLHKKSEKNIDDFIIGPNAKEIKDFFLNKMHKLLKDYKPGSPSMKPDVLKQSLEIENERKKMIEKENKEKKEFDEIFKKYPVLSPIVLKQDNQPDIVLTNQQAVEVMQQQQNYILKLNEKIMELEKIINELKKQ